MLFQPFDPFFKPITGFCGQENDFGPGIKTVHPFFKCPVIKRKFFRIPEKTSRSDKMSFQPGAPCAGGQHRHHYLQEVFFKIYDLYCIHGENSSGTSFSTQYLLLRKYLYHKDVFC